MGQSDNVLKPWGGRAIVAFGTASTFAAERADAHLTQPPGAGSIH